MQMAQMLDLHFGIATIRFGNNEIVDGREESAFDLERQRFGRNRLDRACGIDPPGEGDRLADQPPLAVDFPRPGVAIGHREGRQADRFTRVDLIALPRKAEPRPEIEGRRRDGGRSPPYIAVHPATSRSRQGGSTSPEGRGFLSPSPSAEGPERSRGREGWGEGKYGGDS